MLMFKNIAIEELHLLEAILEELVTKESVSINEEIELEILNKLLDVLYEIIGIKWKEKIEARRRR